MRSFRTKETEEKYEKAVAQGLNSSCFFCDETRQTIVKEFNLFRLVLNDFPYDEITEISHILFPKRHITRDLLTKEEIDELEAIKSGYLREEDYNYILEGITKLSIPAHFHVHPIRLKDR